MQFILVLLVIFIYVCTLSITNFDIFRLGYIFTHSIGTELVSLDSFMVNVAILYPLKIPGNKKRLLEFSKGIKWELWPETASSNLNIKVGTCF